MIKAGERRRLIAERQVPRVAHVVLKRLTDRCSRWEKTTQQQTATQYNDDQRTTAGFLLSSFCWTNAFNR
ncbi:Protein of unknown function [Cotesia congregata]|uniref:Uncharacterized protein n=1 Tax=Cotesia congregata TaxID=51543 RepID=A0A8J2MDI7_COTCN|nr:Protein of unknown function [Cotesia congregata]